MATPSSSSSSNSLADYLQLLLQSYNAETIEIAEDPARRHRRDDRGNDATTSMMAFTSTLAEDDTREYIHDPSLYYYDPYPRNRGCATTTTTSKLLNRCSKNKAIRVDTRWNSSPPTKVRTTTLQKSTTTYAPSSKRDLVSETTCSSSHRKRTTVVANKKSPDNDATSDVYNDDDDLHNHPKLRTIMLDLQPHRPARKPSIDESSVDIIMNFSAAMIMSSSSSSSSSSLQYDESPLTTKSAPDDQDYESTVTASAATAIVQPPSQPRNQPPPPPPPPPRPWAGAA